MIMDVSISYDRAHVHRRRVGDIVLKRDEADESPGGLRTLRVYGGLPRRPSLPGRVPRVWAAAEPGPATHASWTVLS